MTDEQIIKAWEKVLATGDAPIEEGWGCVVPFALVKRTLDAVNRQKETIQNQDEMIRALINAQETLQKETERLNFENLQMVASIKNLKSEAIKEFAEKFEDEMGEDFFNHYPFVLTALDNLVEEMRGDSE